MRLLRSMLLGITLLLPTAALAEVNRSNGEIASIDLKENSIVVTSNDCCGEGHRVSDTTYALKPTTKIEIDGKSAKLSDLKSGDRVQIDYETTEEVVKVIVRRE